MISGCINTCQEDVYSENNSFNDVDMLRHPLPFISNSCDQSQNYSRIYNISESAPSGVFHFIATGLIEEILHHRDRSQTIHFIEVLHCCCLGRHSPDFGIDELFLVILEC